MGAGTFTYSPRFPGQVYDREANLHYNGHRTYDPQLGIYTQPDPIGNVLYGNMAVQNLATRRPVSIEMAAKLYREKPSYNQLYAYAETNPVSKTAESSLFPWLLIPAAVVIYEAVDLGLDYYQFQKCVKACPTNCPDGDTRANALCKQECYAKTWAKPNGAGPWWEVGEK